MAGEREVRAIGPSYYLNDRKTAVQRSINLYVMQVEGLGEDSPLVLESAPGLKLVYDFGTPVRGIHTAEGRFFVVAGTTLQEMSTAETFTARGSLSSATGFVSMTHGQNQLSIVDGTALNVFSLLTGALTPVRK